VNTEDINLLAESIVSRLEERLFSPASPLNMDAFATLVAKKVIELSGEFNQEELIEMAKKVQQSLEPDIRISSLDE
jgi:hypothetical protein